MGVIVVYGEGKENQAGGPAARGRSRARELQGLGTGPGSGRDKWTVMVVGGLSKGPMRFNALLRLIGGVSHRMLTLTLRGFCTRWSRQANGASGRFRQRWI